MKNADTKQKLQNHSLTVKYTTYYIYDRNFNLFSFSLVKNSKNEQNLFFIKISYTYRAIGSLHLSLFE